MSSLSIWLQAIRPKTLAAGVSPVLIGTVLALDKGSFSKLTFIFTMLTALCIQIGTNLANDYFDFIKGADTSARKGPVRVTQSGLVSLTAIKKATALVFSLTAVFGTYLIWQGGFVIACLVALSILLGIIYTAGPISLAYLGLGDLFVFVFFGPVAVAATAFLQTHELSSSFIIAGLAPGALSTAILAVNNLRDVEEDRLANKKTLPVRFGSTFGKAEYVLMFVITAFVPLHFYLDKPFIFLAALFLLPSFPLVRAVVNNKDLLAYNLILQKTAQLLLIYTLLFCIGYLL